MADVSMIDGNIDEELKPCPFCGGKANIYDYFEGYFVIQCDECNVRTLYNRDKNRVIFEWNRRVNND